MVDVREQAALIALLRVADGGWHRVAGLVERAGSASTIVRGDWGYLEPADEDLAVSLSEAVREADVEQAAGAVEQWATSGADLVTVLDAGYPLNLREVHDRPPFLFVRGSLRDQDSRAIAVVGTRRPSDVGLRVARQLAGELATRGVTVVSGLARGIDAVAHQGALDARGPTLAVLGAGISQPIAPAQNQGLAGRVVDAGALVSQFWPDAPPRPQTFPMRNVVTSGLALGTVVVEAGEKGGAAHQARLCLRHGKRLLLVRSLVLREAWARQLATRPGVIVVDTVDDVLGAIEQVLNPPAQLSLC